ncbi:MAG TPA: SAM-dependent methyltransferase [Thermomonospora sp.]|nr:SAM-dependent methyltransferase [Thermomonospora sp.]
MTDDSTPAQVPPGIDTTVPQSARIWNYWLGGKDNYPVDQQAGDAYAKVYPAIVDMARATRYFLARGVRYLAGEVGIRQFLDIGTGLPTVDNTHEVAQRVAPESRIVYVDNDPLVLAHARALLNSTPEGKTDYIDADLREPEKILAAASATLDFDKPVALMLMGILGHLQDFDEAVTVVRRLIDGLPSGSYFMHYDSTATDDSFLEAQQGYDDTGAIPYVLRTPQELARLYEGLELVEPGLVSCSLWRPDPSPFGPPEPVDAYCGVARKP